MSSAIILAFCALTTYAAFKTSFYPIKFFAGVSYWVLGGYLIYYPLITGDNPVNNMVLGAIFIFGFGLMLMPFWYENKNGKMTFRIRLPRVFGGMSEAEEDAMEERNARNFRDRSTAYRARVNRRMGR